MSFQFLILLVVSFLAGSSTILAPCSLPVITAFGSQTLQADKKKIIMSSIGFALGISFVLVIAGVFAGSIGRLLLDYKKELILVFGSLIVLLGISTVLNYNPLQRLNDKGGWKGSFVFGTILSLSWAGCVGPVLAIILIMAASTGQVISGAILLFVYGMGMMIPLILVSYYLCRLSKENLVWRLIKGRIFSLTLGKFNFHFHTTNLTIGIIFIITGVMLLMEVWIQWSLTVLPELTKIIFTIQDMFLRHV